MSIQTKLLSICMQTGHSNSGVKNPETVPFLLVGPPGCGKTELVKATAASIEKALGSSYPCETIACPQIQPEVIGGLPVPNHDAKVTSLYIYSAGKHLAEIGQGCLFLDEFSSAPDPVAAASLTLLQSGTLGDFRMPSSIARGAAMNDPEKATADRPLMAPESNRFCWIPWKLELEEWVDYMRGGQGASTEVVILSKNWEKDYYDQAVVATTGFLRTRDSYLLKEPDPHKATVAWPSPRSWRNATRLIAACLSIGNKINSTLIKSAVEGCVGENASVEFSSWITEMDLPDPEEVLALGSKYELPKRDDRATAILESVSAAACREHANRKQRWDTAIELVEANERKKDVIFSSIKYLMHHKPQGSKVPKAGGIWLQAMKELNIYQK